jgi:hypothetical protein
VQQKRGRSSFGDVTKFLGNTKHPNYTNIVKKVLDSFKCLGCSMSSELHFLHSHLDYFAENLGSLSEGEGKRFHKDVKEIERSDQGRWNINMLVDDWWMLKQEVPESTQSRKGQDELPKKKKKKKYSDLNVCSKLLQ